MRRITPATSEDGQAIAIAVERLREARNRARAARHRQQVRPSTAPKAPRGTSRTECGGHTHEQAHSPAQGRPSRRHLRAVGWDRPLQTYYAQVCFRTDDEPDEGEALIWRGTEPGELPTPEAAIAVITPYAEIPPRLAEQLLADMTATIGEKDGRHQAEVKRRLFGSIH